jgi:hypothetical protein
VAGLVSQLGLHGPAQEDLDPATEWNERGNNESVQLSGFNDELFRRLGGSWEAPPVLGPHWEQDPVLVDQRARATALIAKAFSAQTFVWKDPRNCILLPFWRSVISPPEAAVFVYRHPLEVAGSMKARNHFTNTHGLALWERYVRSAASNLDGIPTLVVAFERVLDETEAWCGELMAFFDTVGLETDRSATERAVRSLDTELRHQRRPPLPDTGLHVSQRAILDVLDPMQGPHLPWSAPDLGEEPEWVEDVLTLRREYLSERRNHRPSSSPLARAGSRIISASQRLRHER